MDKPIIGVYVCWCCNVAKDIADVKTIAEESGKIPNVAISRNYRYMCSEKGHDLILKDVKDLNLDRIIVCGCSGGMNEITLRKALDNAGLKPSLFEMLHISGNDAFNNLDKNAATNKAKELIASAVDKISQIKATDREFVNINPATLVIGGGIAGMTAALELADANKKVYLIEKTSKLGGRVAEADLTFPHLYSAQQMVKTFIEKVSKNKKIEIFFETELKNLSGSFGNFETTIKEKNGEETKLNFGNVIVATGLKPWDPTPIEDYGYGRLPNVITSVEFEKMLLSGKIRKNDDKDPKHIAIIHCVGSRNRNYQEYCSRICCMVALKYANQIRGAFPKAHIYDIYAEMRAMTKGCEEFYSLTSRKHVIFMLMDQENDLPKIRQAAPKDPCEMIIDLNEKISGQSVEVMADLVILMVGMEAQDNAGELAKVLGIKFDNKFFVQKHPEMDTVGTEKNGIYIVGTCQSPKDIPDSISQARAAAGRILGNIFKGKVPAEESSLRVNEEHLCGSK